LNRFQTAKIYYIPCAQNVSKHSAGVRTEPRQRLAENSNSEYKM